MPFQSVDYVQAGASFPTVRMRRLRAHPALRDLVRETRLSVQQLVLPLFICHGEDIQRPIQSMPGHAQLSVDQLDREIETVQKLSIPALMLFGLPEKKDALGSESFHPDGIVQRAIARIKKLAPNLLIIADACFCDYTDHGHCGVPIARYGRLDVDNDATLQLLQRQAVSYAIAGADMIAPSGMMDGMVGAIRSALDKEGFEHLPILSYSAKYASAFYAPFREAICCASHFGDRNTYQMDPANGDEALREVGLDLVEGADLVMVKPASSYLDVIYRIKSCYPGVPLAAYQVSGEFSMIRAAAQNGWIDEKRTVLEQLISMRRAGADFIITYYAKEVASWLQS